MYCRLISVLAFRVKVKMLLIVSLGFLYPGVISRPLSSVQIMWFGLKD